MAAGIGISLIVQYDYPEIFTPFPESWDQKRRDKAHDLWLRINEMRAFYDHNDPPGWQFGKVADLIAQAKEGISSWEAYRTDVKAGVGIKKPEAIPRIVASVMRPSASCMTGSRFSAICGSTWKTPSPSDRLTISDILPPTARRGAVLYIEEGEQRWEWEQHLAMHG